MKLLNARAGSMLYSLTEYLRLVEPIAVDGDNSVLPRRNWGYLVWQLAAQQNGGFPGNKRDSQTHRFPGSADLG